jgi:hypothetical protein
VAGSSGNSLSAAKANNQREPARGFTTFRSVAGNWPLDSNASGFLAGTPGSN